MTLLTRENLSPKGTKTVKVDLSDWSEIDPATGQHGELHVFVREFSVREKDMYEEKLWQGRGKKRELKLVGMRAKLVLQTACDEQGNLIYKPEDLEFVQSLPSSMVSKIYDASAKLNGYSEDEDDEEVLKN